ncbi:cadherin-like domain-containing protein, partial [Epibacterium ulvae]|uniref:Ig-like domain-containing protein n=1 Tax=Epibacterium ulvae TaxID=1156985 RepID=UPI001BFC34C8
MENLISKITADIIAENSAAKTAFDLPEGYDSIAAVPTLGTLYDAGEGRDLIAVDAEGSEGVDITAISRWSSLGRELGAPGFILNTLGATADFDGQTVAANHFSLNDNRAFGGSTDLLSATALETTLKLGSVALNVESIVATAGNDRYFGYDEDATLYAGDGNDYVRSLGGDKELYGEAGNDDFYVRGGQGALIDGGSGDDAASFAGETQGLTIQSVGRYGDLGRALGIEQNTAAYTVTHTGATAEFDGETVAATYNTLNTNSAGEDDALSDSALDTALAFGHVTTDVETLRGSEFDDTFFGGRYADNFDAGAGDDWIDSRSGDDVIDAGAGDDNIVLTAGNNSIDGGAGEDLLWLRGTASDFQVVAAADGSFTITTAAGDTSTLRGVENVRFSDGSIVALADLASDVLPDPTPEPDPEPTPLPDLVATDDAASLDEDGSVVLDLLGNDSGEGLTLAAIATPANGTATINANGTVTFTPDADFNGVTEFTYTVRDAAGQTASATVHVTVDQVNDAPIVTEVASNPIAETTPGGTTLARV